jgi:hypothetical protein
MNGKNTNVNPSNRGNANTPRSTNAIDNPIHVPGIPHHGRPGSRVRWRR